MEIRFLTTGDASEYWRLRLEALETDSEAFSASAEEHHSLSLEEVRKRIGADGGDKFIVGAIENHQLAGTAGFYRETGLKARHKGHIWGVYVTPGQRGKGVGKGMMQQVLERAAAIEGVEQVLLAVTTTQTAASRLYRSLGFEPFGCEPRALKIGDRFFDEEYLVLRLGKDQAKPDPQEGRKKKRPRLFSPGRLGSPPPGLPNHEMDIRVAFGWCKRHFSNTLR